MSAAPARGRLSRALRIAGANCALILGGLALVAIAGEAWLRLTTPSFTVSLPARFVPGVGVLYEPHAEVRHTNDLDFWTVQRANSLGFLDREPPDPARAAASCHVAVIGDSFVDAQEVPIADKVHVRLEALAAAALPTLDVTASAYGRYLTGQANQLPFYDLWVRGLRPNLVVLVAVDNDFRDSSAALRALQMGWDPARMPYAYPQRAADGSVRLRPPHPDFQPSSRFRWWGVELTPASERWYEALGREAAERSLFARWLDAKRRALIPHDPRPDLAGRAALLAARPGYGWVLDGWEPTTDHDLKNLLLTTDEPPPLFAEAIDDMAWALAEFKRRADRDGAALVVLATHGLGGAGARYTDILHGMADPLGIPVINQHDWILARGGRVGDANFPHDTHWNAQGHQWAAEALLDWLRRHPEVCEDAA